MIRTIEVETDDDFEACDDCVNSEDTEVICKMRGCIHAILDSDIKECYTPKKERETMNIIRWIDYAKKSVKICEQIKEITNQPIRGEAARIKAIKDIRTIMREV